MQNNSTCHAVEVTAVSKSYRVGSRMPWTRTPRKTVVALHSVTLAVRRGEVYGLVGRNGYGKTTLMKCICALLEPDSGTIRVCGYDLRSYLVRARRSIGFVSADERSFYWRLTGRQNLMFFARLQGLPEGDAARRIESLSEALEVRQLLDRRFHECSTGNRQKFGVVRALLHEPQLLILDEPTRSLDPVAAKTLRRTLVEWVTAREERSVLITSHNLDEVAELSSRVGIMSRGQLAEEGSLAELRRRFDDRELVRLWIKDADDGQLHVLATAHPWLTFGRDSIRGEFLEFRRCQGDSLLNQALQVVIGQQISISSFERKELSLQDIVDRVDTKGNES